MLKPAILGGAIVAPLLAVSLSACPAPANHGQYRELDLTRFRPAQLRGEDPIAITEAIFGSPEKFGKYSESSEAAISNKRAVVTFIKSNLSDDSVQAIRIRAEYERSLDGWQLQWAGQQVRCQSGRGHRWWSKNPCS